MKAKLSQNGTVVSDLPQLVAKEVAYSLTEIEQCKSNPKDGALVSFQLRVAETNNTNNTVDLQRFGVPTNSFCTTKQVTAYNDTEFSEVQVFLNDTRVLGFTLTSRKGAIYNFGKSTGAT